MPRNKQTCQKVNISGMPSADIFKALFSDKNACLLEIKIKEPIKDLISWDIYADGKKKKTVYQNSKISVDLVKSNLLSLVKNTKNLSIISEKYLFFLRG